MRRQHQGGTGGDQSGLIEALDDSSGLRLPRRSGSAARGLRSATAVGLVAAVTLGGGVVAPVTRAVLSGGATEALAESVPAPRDLSSFLGVEDDGARRPNWLASSNLRLAAGRPARLAQGRMIEAGQVLAALVRAREVERARQAALAAQQAAAEAAAREAAAQAAAAQAAAEQRAAAERAVAERLAAEQRAAEERAEAERLAAEEAEAARQAAEEAAAAEAAEAAEAAWRAQVEREQAEWNRAAAARRAAEQTAGNPAATPGSGPADAGRAPSAREAAATTPVATAAPAPVAAVAMAPAAAAAPASATEVAEAQFLALLNAERAKVGLGPLAPEAGLQASARAQAGRIAAAGALSHQNLSPLLGQWNAAGENLGFGPSVSTINNALVNSPGHYANIVGSRFTHVGVGVVVDGNGRVWVAQVFGG